MGTRGLDWSDLRYEPMVGFCDHGNEPSDTITSTCVSPNRTFLAGVSEITFTGVPCNRDV